MFSVTECKYHAPCGLCTYYNKKCKDVCGNNNKHSPLKGKIRNHIDENIKNTDKNIDPVMRDIIDGKGLRPLTEEYLNFDENNPPKGICISP